MGAAAQETAELMDRQGQKSCRCMARTTRGKQPQEASVQPGQGITLVAARGKKLAEARRAVEAKVRFKKGPDCADSNNEIGIQKHAGRILRKERRVEEIGSAPIASSADRSEGVKFVIRQFNVERSRSGQNGIKGQETG